MGEQEKSDGKALAKIVGMLAKGSVQLYGGLHAILTGDVATGLVIQASSEAAGAGTEALADWVNSGIRASKVRRVLPRLLDVKQRLEAEGVTPDPEQMDDAFVEAAKVLADAETEEKRTLIADLLMNIGRRSQSGAVLEDGLFALGMIGHFPPGTARVFAAFEALESEHGQPMVEGIEAISMHSGLSATVCEGGCRHLEAVYPPLIDSTGLEEAGFLLTDAGRWLAEWVRKNPKNPEVGEPAS